MSKGQGRDREVGARLGGGEAGGGGGARRVLAELAFFLSRRRFPGRCDRGISGDDGGSELSMADEQRDRSVPRILLPESR